MNTQERRQDILRLLRRDSAVEVDALADRYGVATQTIRRDLSDLCLRGLAERTHGGARRPQNLATAGYEERRSRNAAGKVAIAGAAAELIPDGASVMLNIGTTTEQVAQALCDHSGLTVISNNVNVITSLISAPVRDLILVGGSVRRDDGAIVGEDAVAFLANYKADFAVIGASALDEDGAVLDFDAREVAVAQAILRNARQKILVCDATKFAQSAPIRITDIAELDFVVTDGPLPAAFTDAAHIGGTKIVIAPKQGEK